MSPSPTTLSVPEASDAMAAVIVRLPSKGESVNRVASAAPPARKTTIVSPMARETATMKAATMPEMAAGTTTVVAVAILRAPRPADASRKESGTAAMASSEMEATRGMVRMPTPIPAAASEPARAGANSSQTLRSQAAVNPKTATITAMAPTATMSADESEPLSR